MYLAQSPPARRTYTIYSKTTTGKDISERAQNSYDVSRP